MSTPKTQVPCCDSACENSGTQTVTGYMIPESSPLIGKRLQDVAEVSGVAGVLRDGKVDNTAFGGGYTLRKGDTLLVIGDLSGLKKFEQARSQ